LPLAVIFKVLGAAIFTTMLLVQLAIRHQLQSIEQETIDLPALRTALIGVQPDMDAAWDILYA